MYCEARFPLGLDSTKDCPKYSEEDPLQHASIYFDTVWYMGQCIQEWTK